jgi:hypothetical protein
MSSTTCDEWRDEMNDDQRDQAAAEYAGSDSSVRLHIAITDLCATLDTVASDEGDSASIDDVVDILITTDQYSPLPS